MSSYFDDFDMGTRSYEDLPGRAFLMELRDQEALMVREVTLVCGDRHFPEDLREKIMGCISVHRVRPEEPTNPANDAAVAARRSELSARLHSLFHEVARRRIHAPYGLILDNPRGTLRLRDDWAKETFGGENETG